MKQKCDSSNLAATILQNLRCYVLAAGALAVGVLAFSQRSEARIIFTPVDVLIGLGDSYDLDLTNSGTIDFTILATSLETGCGLNQTASEIPASGNSAEYFRGGYPAALRRGDEISSRQLFNVDEGVLVEYVWSPVFGCHRDTYGEWDNLKNQYLGLQFQIHGKTHYGWARLSVIDAFRFGLRIVLTGYAYETIAGKGIIAGRKVSSSNPDDATSSSAHSSSISPYSRSQSLREPEPQRSASH
jgi:hypothetical protein